MTQTQKKKLDNNNNKKYLHRLDIEVTREGL